MKQHRRLWTAVGWCGGLTLALLAITVLSGCSSGQKNDHDHDKDAKVEKDKDHNGPVTEVDIKAERDKLSPEDRKLADAQDACPIMPDNRLGVMGKPIKVLLKDGMGMEQTVFVCCKGCVKKAERKPDETLAKVAELKAKNKVPGPK